MKQTVIAVVCMGLVSTLSAWGGNVTDAAPQDSNIKKSGSGAPAKTGVYKKPTVKAGTTKKAADTGAAVEKAAPAAPSTPAPEGAKNGAPISPELAVKAEAATGLEVDFYDFYPKDAAGIDSMKIAKDWISGHKPDVTLKLGKKRIKAPADDSDSMCRDVWNTKLGVFLLGADDYEARKARGDELPGRLDKPVGNRTIYVFRGFFNVARKGTVKIMAPVDDDVEISVGDTVVHSRGSFGGMADADAPESVGYMDFAEPGIYPIKAVLYDRDPGLGLKILSDIEPGGTTPDGKAYLPILDK